MTNINPGVNHDDDDEQARKSSEDTQVTGYARFEKSLGPKYFYQPETLTEWKSESVTD